MQHKPFLYVSPLLAMSLCLAAPAPTKASELTARDLRMQTQTSWDYQPGQGPRHRAKDQDFFRPGSEPKAEPLPVPELEPGAWRDAPSTEARLPPKKQDPSEIAKTKTSADIGVQLSSYHYHESSLGVKIQGPEYGINLSATGELGNYWFLRGEGRFVGGKLDYKGSGTVKDHPNNTADFRVTVGRDFLFGNFGVSPFVGIGYRYLNNDLRGTSTTGAYGYVRRSQYLFMPIGLQPRVVLPNGDKLSLTAEFNPLLRGWQDSNLSGAINGYPDLRNVQKEGYGLHSSLMYQRGDWSFGPFVNYWNINQSDRDCNAGTLFYGCGYEPHNHTLEYGMQFRYTFYKPE